MQHPETFSLESRLTQAQAQAQTQAQTEKRDTQTHTDTDTHTHTSRKDVYSAEQRGREAPTTGSQRAAVSHKSLAAAQISGCLWLAACGSYGVQGLGLSV